MIGGFHDHNEANYTLTAMHFSDSSLLFPNPDGHLFLETPPFYAYVLALVFRFTGVSVLAARLVSVASSLGLIAATFLLGRRLYGEAAGLAAAVLLAVSPVAVLTGRNIQTDSLFLFLLVAALLIFLRARPGGGAGWTGFGALLGLAIFTKLFAVVGAVALLAWILRYDRERVAASKRDPWRALALAAALPLVFYGFHTLRDFAYLRSQVAGGAAASTTLPASGAEWGAFLLEAMWAFSPAVAILLAAGGAAALARRSRESAFALLPLCGFAAFYLVVHKHSYYLLTLLPFGALLAGRFLAGLRRGPYIGWTAVAALTGVWCSLVDLTGMKLGFHEFSEFGRIAGALPGETHPLVITRDILTSHGTTLQFYDPRTRLVTIEDLPAEPDGRLRLPAGETPHLLSYVPPETRPVPVGWLFGRDRYGLELFGRTFAEAHANPNFFRQGAYIAERTGGPLDFGLRLLRPYPAMALIPVSPEVGLYRTEHGIEVRRAGAAR